MPIRDCSNIIIILIHGKFIDCELRKKMKLVFTVIFLFAAKVSHYLKNVGKCHCQCLSCLERGSDSDAHMNTPRCIILCFL